jgi:uncharacterized membrane protein YeaQ/YmgE (transglycosylase-associated protein family)
MQTILLWALVGLAAGWLASKVVASPHGIIVDLILGIVGALIGGFLLSALVKQLGAVSNAQLEQYRLAAQQSLVWTWESMLTHIAVAFLGALLLLLVHRLLFASHHRGLQRA